MTEPDDDTGSSTFEAHLDRVVRTTWVALAIHQVTHPGCTDVRHLTTLDKTRAEAALNAMNTYQWPPAAEQEPR